MKVGYDPLKDLAPVSGGVHFPNVLVVHAGAGVKTLAEFVALAKRRPAASTTPPPAPARPRTWPANCSAARRHRDGARSLQGRRAGTAGPARRAADVLFLGPADGAAACGKRQPGAARDDRPDASGLPAEHSDRRRIRLSRLRGAELVCLRRAGKTPVPILDRWNAEIVKVLDDPAIRDALNKQGMTPQPTRVRAGRLHEEGRRQVERDRAREEDHRELSGAPASRSH